MIASLPMYVVPETRAAHDAFWALVRDGLRDAGLAAPDALDHAMPATAGWAHPDLVLSQICNLPYRRYFADRVTRIAAADYGLDGCAPGRYRSVFVVRADDPATTPEDLAGRTMAFSEVDSHSGWGAPAQWALERGLRFRPVLETGAHRASLEAVARGQADFASIDAQTFEVLKRVAPQARSVRVVGATGTSPGMTFVTRAGQDPAPYRAALADALAALPADLRGDLGLRSIVVLPDEAYDLPFPPDPDAWRD